MYGQKIESEESTININESKIKNAERKQEKKKQPQHQIEPTPLSSKTSPPG